MNRFAVCDVDVSPEVRGDHWVRQQERCFPGRRSFSKEDRFSDVLHRHGTKWSGKDGRSKPSFWLGLGPIRVQRAGRFQWQAN